MQTVLLDFSRSNLPYKVQYYIKVPELAVNQPASWKPCRKDAPHCCSYTASCTQANLCRFN